MKTIAKISLDKCKYYFDYTDDGKLLWKHISHMDNKSTIGSVAGWFMKSTSYYMVKFGGQIALQHRILYQLYHDVELENEHIDHIDNDKTNNRKENLRLCTHTQNSVNQKHRKNNKLKLKNITEKTVRKHSYWNIKITNNGIKHDKYFNKNNFTLEEVIKIRDIMLKELHGEFHNLG